LVNNNTTVNDPDESPREADLHSGTRLST